MIANALRHRPDLVLKNNKINLAVWIVGYYLRAIKAKGTKSQT
jgi:hypothetical protein